MSTDTLRVGSGQPWATAKTEQLPQIELASFRRRRWGVLAGKIALVAALSASPLAAVALVNKGSADVHAREVAASFDTEQRQRASLLATGPLYVEEIGTPHTEQNVWDARNAAETADARYHRAVEAEGGLLAGGVLGFAATAIAGVWRRRKIIKEHVVSAAKAAWTSLNEPLPPAGSLADSMQNTMEIPVYLPPQPTDVNTVYPGIRDAGIPFDLEPAFHY